MKQYIQELAVPHTNTTAGAAIAARDFRYKTVQVIGSFSGNLTIEVSLDGGTTYAAVQTGITAAGIYTIPHTCTHLRMHTVSYVSGTPRAYFGAFDSRSDE